MKTRYKVLLIFLAILLLTYFVGGASALSGLLYVFAYFSVLAIIGSFGAISNDGGLMLIKSLFFGGICLGGALILDNYAENEKEDKEYQELMQKSHIITFDAKNKTLDKMQDFAAFAKDKNQSDEIENRIKIVCDSLYKIAENKGTSKDWLTYIKIVPQEYHKDAFEKIEKLEAKAWNTDSKAWKQASTANTVSSYEKYLSMYPRGKHAKGAEKRIVDIGIANAFSGEHGSLPQMDRVSSSQGSKSLIKVDNNTGYTLTLLYSGTDSKRLVLAPQESDFISLNNGTYQIAAFVSASNVRSYAGTEQLLGGEYSVSYYISSY